MSFPKAACVMAVAAAALLAGRSASAGVVWATDFNSATTGPIANSTILNQGGTTTTDDVTVNVGAGVTAAIVDRGSGNLAMQLTDNSSDGALTRYPRFYSSTFGPLSTNGTGNNRLYGSFDYTRLLSETSINTSPVFVFAASSAGQTLMDPATNAIRFSIESNGHLFYTIGGATPASVDSGLLLTPGTEYHFEIDSDFSSATQDTWSLKVTAVGSTTPLVNLNGLATRAANVQVNIISMMGGANQNAVNASPFAQVDNISFSAAPVPEPTAMGFLAASGGLLLWRKR